MLNLCLEFTFHYLRLISFVPQVCLSRRPRVTAPLKSLSVEIEHLSMGSGDVASESAFAHLESLTMAAASLERDLRSVAGSLEKLTLDGIPTVGHLTDRLVVGEYTAATSCCFLLLPVAPSVSYSWLDAPSTRSSKLPPSPAVSYCLSMSTTRLSLLPNPHPQHRRRRARVVGAGRQYISTEFDRSPAF